jgi:uncharacterized protein (DUF486 family)
MLKTALLLLLSNLFMIVAWYWHLKHKDVALWKVILISWVIAFVEYCIAVPANRIGSNAGMSGAQLKIMQEVITLLVFVGFAATYLGEKLKWNHAVAFLLVVAAVAFTFYEPGAKAVPVETPATIPASE